MNIETAPGCQWPLPHSTLFRARDSFDTQSRCVRACARTHVCACVSRVLAHVCCAYVSRMRMYLFVCARRLFLRLLPRLCARLHAHVCSCVSCRAGAFCACKLHCMACKLWITLRVGSLKSSNDRFLATCEYLTDCQLTL